MHEHMLTMHRAQAKACHRLSKVSNKTKILRQQINVHRLCVCVYVKQHKPDSNRVIKNGEKNVSVEVYIQERHLSTGR